MLESGWDLKQATAKQRRNTGILHCVQDDDINERLGAAGFLLGDDQASGGGEEDAGEEAVGL
jgi:hypothetical protein